MRPVLRPVLGRIIKWPGGYAMSLDRDALGVVRCCPGHETPEAAKQHGIVRAIEIAQATADDDLKVWAAMGTEDGAA